MFQEWGEGGIKENIVRTFVNVTTNPQYTNNITI
jgi:hypothetical protein